MNARAAAHDLSCAPVRALVTAGSTATREPGLDQDYSTTAPAGCPAALELVERQRLQRAPTRAACSVFREAAPLRIRSPNGRSAVPPLDESRIPHVPSRCGISLARHAAVSSSWPSTRTLVVTRRTVHTTAHRSKFAKPGEGALTAGRPAHATSRGQEATAGALPAALTPVGAPCPATRRLTAPHHRQLRKSTACHPRADSERWLLSHRS